MTSGDKSCRAVWEAGRSDLSDADLFINGANGIGRSSQYQANVPLGEWHRLAFAFDLTTSTLWKYVDGVLVNQQTLSAGVDGRWSIGSTALLFADDNTETQPGYVSSVQIHNARLTTTQ